MSDAIQQFRAALAERGIIPPADLLVDGQLHRCDAEGKHGKGDAAYLLHLNDIPAGGFENHRDGIGWENWRADPGRILTGAEKAAHRAKVRAARREREASEIQRHAEAASRARSILDAATGDPAMHPYAQAKRVPLGPLVNAAPGPNGVGTMLC